MGICMSNDEEKIIAEVKRDCEMAKKSAGELILQRQAVLIMLAF